MPSPRPMMVGLAWGRWITEGAYRVQSRAGVGDESLYLLYAHNYNLHGVCGWNMGVSVLGGHVCALWRKRSVVGPFCLRYGAGETSRCLSPFVCIGFSSAFRVLLSVS